MEPVITKEERYKNALMWIRVIAGLHYVGGAFDPEHMRTIANMAVDALEGKDLPDCEKSLAESREHAEKMAAEIGKLAE